MAVIGRRALLAVLSAAVLKAADDADYALRAINRVTTALSGGDAEGAIGGFDKSCSDYEKLEGYFAALTSSFSITNEADVVDEHSSGDSTTLTLDWTLTLESLASDASERREQQVAAQIARNSGRIVAFSPADLFRPA
jgi:hypothetical protein